MADTAALTTLLHRIRDGASLGDLSKVNISARNADGRTLLAFACAFGNVSAVSATTVRYLTSDTPSSSGVSERSAAPDWH